MTLEELIGELHRIIEVHPEAKEAQVIATWDHGQLCHINYVGYDKRHRPARIKLSE